MEWLVNHMRSYCTHFNFCRGQVDLKYEDERKVKRKNKPARVWNYGVKVEIKRFDLDLENINHIIVDYRQFCGLMLLISLLDYVNPIYNSRIISVESIFHLPYIPNVKISSPIR